MALKQESIRTLASASAFAGVRASKSRPHVALASLAGAADGLGSLCVPTSERYHVVAHLVDCCWLRTREVFDLPRRWNAVIFLAVDEGVQDV